MSLRHGGFSTDSAFNLNTPITNHPLWKCGRQCVTRTSGTTLGAMSPAVVSADTIPEKRHKAVAADSPDLSIHVVGARIHQAPVEVIMILSMPCVWFC